MIWSGETSPWASEIVWMTSANSRCISFGRRNPKYVSMMKATPPLPDCELMRTIG